MPITPSGTRTLRIRSPFGRANSQRPRQPDPQRNQLPHAFRHAFNARMRKRKAVKHGFAHAVRTAIGKIQLVRGKDVRLVRHECIRNRGKRCVALLRAEEPQFRRSGFYGKRRFPKVFHTLYLFYPIIPVDGHSVFPMALRGFHAPQEFLFVKIYFAAPKQHVCALPEHAHDVTRAEIPFRRRDARGQETLSMGG